MPSGTIQGSLQPRTRAHIKYMQSAPALLSIRNDKSAAAFWKRLHECTLCSSSSGCCFAINNKHLYIHKMHTHNFFHPQSRRSERNAFAVESERASTLCWCGGDFAPRPDHVWVFFNNFLLNVCTPSNESSVWLSTDVRLAAVKFYDAVQQVIIKGIILEAIIRTWDLQTHTHLNATTTFLSRKSFSPRRLGP